MERRGNAISVPFRERNLKREKYRKRKNGYLNLKPKLKR
jgi:hypothetical protein